VTPERLDALECAVDDALCAEGATVDEVSAVVITLLGRIAFTLCRDDVAGRLRFIDDIADTARAAMRNYRTDHEIH
jgi:hypothetical protein